MIEPSLIVALLTLTVLEIVLGVDNIIFISILTGKLPPEQRDRARLLGIGLALITRLALLFSIKGLIGLDKFVLFNAMNHGFTVKDLVLLLGGLFLIWKSVKEIHEKLEGEAHADSGGAKSAFAAVVGQIVMIDIVFSIDSVITAVGMVDNIGVMVAAVIIAVIFMLGFSGKISRFVEAHPTIKILALSFLILIGLNLVAESTGVHIEKGYTYFAMAFAVVVEVLNIRMLKKGTKPVELRDTPHDPASTS